MTRLSVQSADKILENLPILEKLVDRLLATLGPVGTVVVLVGLVGAAVCYRVYADRRQERGWQAALDEKERTVQRLAQQERAWRMLFMQKEMGVSASEVDRLLGSEAQLKEETEARVAKLRPGD